MDLEAGYYNKWRTLSVKHLKWRIGGWVVSWYGLHSPLMALLFMSLHTISNSLPQIFVYYPSLSLSPPFPFSFLFAVLPTLILHIIQTCSWFPGCCDQWYCLLRNTGYSHGYIIQILQLLIMSSCYWIVGRYGYGRSIAFSLFPSLRVVTFCVQSITHSFLASLFTSFSAYPSFFSGSTCPSFSLPSAIPSEDNRWCDSRTAWEMEHKVLCPCSPSLFRIGGLMNAWLKACWFPLSLLTHVTVNSGEPFVNVIGECCEVQHHPSFCLDILTSVTPIVTS